VRSKARRNQLNLPHGTKTKLDMLNISLRRVREAKEEKEKEGEGKCAAR